MITPTSSKPKSTGLNIDGENLKSFMLNPTGFLCNHLCYSIPKPNTAIQICKLWIYTFGTRKTQLRKNTFEFINQETKAKHLYNLKLYQMGLQIYGRWTQISPKGSASEKPENLSQSQGYAKFRILEHSPRLNNQNPRIGLIRRRGAMSNSQIPRKIVGLTAKDCIE